MKRNAILLAAFCLLLTLTACGQPGEQLQPTDPDTQEDPSVPTAQTSDEGAPVRTILLSDSAIICDDPGVGDNVPVFASHDIIYYEDRDSYDSGYAYGEGEDWEKHSADLAAAHTVVNITEPGTYCLTGTLSRGQIRVDLGEDAFTDPAAKVNLVLKDAHITCEVAPAILFLNVYECDNQWEQNTPTYEIDTTEAGANLILSGNNTVNGSHVARVYQDGGGEKKLWKQDAAVYSYMSMNVSGDGSLDITADNEGLDTELHLTINSGRLNIRAGNDGINTNEDGVSVTTINGGSVHILAGLGEEGDGIDSNGWLVINGGEVIASAKPMADAGLDSDMGSYINGGTVLALGSTMDWAESDSQQVTMNLQFAAQQPAGSYIEVVTPEDGVVFGFDIAQAPLLKDEGRTFQGMILSCAGLEQGQSYKVKINGVEQAYTGTDVQTGPGMGGGFGGQRPGGMAPPEGFASGQPPEGANIPEGMTPPEGFQSGQMPQMPDGETPPEPPQGMGGMTPPENAGGAGPVQTLFFMQDKVNSFSGVTDAEE